PFIALAEQHSRVLEVLLPWLDRYLRADCTRGESFLSELENGNGVGKWTSQIEGAELFPCAEGCAIPENLVVTQETTGFSISWSPVVDALGYQLQARLDGVPVGTVNSFSTSYAAAQLDNSMDYEFRVRAYCPVQGLSGVSAWSGSSSVMLALLNSGGLTLKYSDASPGSIISIQSMNGELLMEKALVDSKGELNISFLPKGFFLAKIQTSQEVKLMKFSVM
ncbi:MAG TPA: hypothetical protein VJ949_01925, partial [Cryomorphaceae bacterium]|nr:hypothetical protein [Cryomorphaceae bacterium]